MAETEADSSAATPGKRIIKIEDLYTIPRDEPSSLKLTRPILEMRDEIQHMYLYEYGKGLDEFFETTWYTEQGLQYLLHDPIKYEMFGGMLELFASTKANNYEKFLKIPQIEARVTWMLLCLPRAVSERTDNGATAHPTPASAAQLSQVLRRSSIFEDLIVNNNPSENPLPFEGTSTSDPVSSIAREHQFWSELGRFVTLPLSDRTVNEECLFRLSRLLNQHENRDVLYSMALVRHLSSSDSSVGDKTNGRGFNGEERLVVAKKFIEDEASSKGTTQVVQRLCGMAVRSWVALR